MATTLKDKEQRNLQFPLIKKNNIIVPKNQSFCCDTGEKEVGANLPDKELLNIQNRRYLGNKYKLLHLIDHVIQNNCSDFESFCDIFAGTGVVGYAFNRKNIKIITNELLYSNYISLYAWLSPEYYDDNKIDDILLELNEIKPDKGNYASTHFGNKYFSLENAKKIGEIRKIIEKRSLNLKEKSILLTSLLYAIDKVANTCGHYDAFRKKLDTLTPIKLLKLNINQKANVGNEVFNEDANQLIRKIKSDILYIDPPYNSRQYSDTYHLLENIIAWQRPNVYGKAKKMNRSKIKSSYCTREASKAFHDLITNAKCRYILVSYNNMSEKGNMRSNARIKDHEIIETLKSRGNVEIYEQAYKPFSTGKSTTEDHSERVFVCKVIDKS